MREKCEVLQQKLELLVQTLSKEESYFSDNTEDTDTLKLEALSSNQDDDNLEKPLKDITNVKRGTKKRYIERDTVMSRYGMHLNSFEFKNEIYVF